MIPLRALSLKFWIPLLVAAIFILLWSFMMWRTYQQFESDLAASSMQFVRQDVASLQREIENHLVENNASEATRALLLRGTNVHYQVLAAINERGVIEHSTRLIMVNERAQDVLSLFDIQRFSQARLNNRTDIRLMEDRSLITAYAPLSLARLPDEIRPSRIGVIFLLYDLTNDRMQIGSRVWQSGLQLGGFLLLGMLALILFLNHYVTTPIQKLAQATNEVASNDSIHEMNITGYGEVARLGASFNEMREQLRIRFEERNHAERALIAQQQQQRDLLDNTSSVIYIKDREGRYLFVNRMFLNLFNVSEEDVKGKTAYDFYPHEQAKIFQENDLLATTASKPLEFENVATVNGIDHIYLTVKFPLRNESGKIYAVCAICTDITDRKRVEEQIQFQAHFDSLTGLPNRFLALDRLSQMLKQAKRNNEAVAIFFLDLDDFKKVNDSLGHEAGDKLLIKAAQRLSNNIRSGDTAARLGGDEFLVLMRDISEEEDTRAAVEHLISLFNRVFDIDGRELMLTTSIGIALSPRDGETPSELLRKADLAMYSAKALGRNTYSYFTSHMNKDVSRRLLVEEQMRSALDRHEFEVFYQPIIEAVTGRIQGAEALLRWDNEQLGQVTPAEFIPIAEYTGLIIPIGKFVLTEALQLTPKLQKAYGDNFQISVNLSPTQFRDPGLITFVKDSAYREGVSGNNLVMEITEGVLMGGDPKIEESLNALNRFGIGIAMDDFGTGYSSLNYLRRYSFETLKIDRSFIEHITEATVDQQLVRATIAMAHAMGLKVIAEGVETREQLTILQQMHCDYVQGYFFSRPMPAQAVLALDANSSAVLM